MILVGHEQIRDLPALQSYHHLVVDVAVVTRVFTTNVNPVFVALVELRDQLLQSLFPLTCVLIPEHDLLTRRIDRVQI